MKRLCLLAGFHPYGQISDYVVYYTRALAQVADVYYWADCLLPENELAKLTPYVKGAWGQSHGKYDFGSWQKLIEHIGWDTITQYDECLFVNDSVFAPLFALPPILEKASNAPIDAWALNSFDKEYFASFFFVLKQRVLKHPQVQSFFNHIETQKTPNDVIQKYEKPLAPLLQQYGFSCAVFSNKIHNLFDYWREGVKTGFPTLKIGIFTRDYYEPQWLGNWRAFLQKHTSYPIELIDQHLRSLNIDPNAFCSWKLQLRSCWELIRRQRQKWFRIHFYKGQSIIVLFGVTVRNTLTENKKSLPEF